MTKYSLQKAQKPSIPTIDVARREDGLFVATFGPNTYNANIASMKGPYFNSQEHPNLAFRPASTAEAIDYIAGNITQVKKEILDPRWAQVGRIARTSQGVFVNVTGNEDEATLKGYLERRDKLDDMCFSRKKAGVVFAPYESFKTGVQEAGDFVEGGLARVLEQTAQKAENMSVITSKYPRGVNVWGFEPAKNGEVLHRVASLGSGWCTGDRLSVGGYFGDSDGSFAFGVSESAEGA